MGAKVRLYQRRIRSATSTKKITRAMELVAGSRIIKAQQAMLAARPYAEAITAVVSAVASQTAVDHPLTTGRAESNRAAIVIVTSDRGFAGPYGANVLRAGEELAGLLRSEGKESVPYLIGRKAVGFYRFRGRDVEHQWTGFSERPGYGDAKAIADAVIEAFVAGSAGGGVDEIHLVHTEFRSLASQRVAATRVLPLAVEYTEDAPQGVLPLYEFEPAADQVLDRLLPAYVESRFYSALLEAAASEQAARQRAMKSATDNAEELIKDLTRLTNAARQAEITQEIMEIVGGAEALAHSGSE
ncbi:MAG: F0F1 ATP synthase subunit gamma [Mycobacteriales bacterium]